MRAIRIKNYIVTTSIETILTRLRDIVYPISGKLRDVKVSDEEIVITCPNEDHAGGKEETPDCHINLKDDSRIPYGWFHCFACESSGSFIKFVALTFNSSTEFAENWLIENYGSRAFDIQDLGPDLTLEDKETKLEINKEELKKYLSWCPYFEQRKLSREICEHFQLKYDPINRQVLFPCFDKNGNIVMLYKRSVDRKLFHIDKSVEKPLYGINEVYKNNIDKIIITEGPFDMLTATQYGFPAVATIGSPSESQMQQINKSPASKIYLMFDNDAGGKSFTEFAHKKLSKRFSIIDVQIPNGYKDINDLDYDTFWTTIKQAEKNSYIL